MEDTYNWAAAVWTVCATFLIIGTVVWVITLDRKVRKLDGSENRD